jgi:Transposase DDE domain
LVYSTSPAITVGSDLRSFIGIVTLTNDRRDESCMRALNVTPHIAQNTSGRRSAIDARTTRHPGYSASQQTRKRIEEPFGWGKTIGGLARPMLRGVQKLGFKFTLTMAGYNLIRLPKLLEAAA